MSEEKSQFYKALNEVKTIVSQLEAQDLETLGFVPTLECEVLHPEGVKNMLDCGYITKSESSQREWEAICKYTLNPEERIKNFKKFMGEE